MLPTERCGDHLGAARGRPIDGIVGHQVFAQVLLTYDDPAGELRVRTGALTDDLPGIAPMATGKRPFLGALLLEGGEDGGAPRERKLDVLLDTGSSHGLSLPDLDELQLVAPASAVGGRMLIGGLALGRAGRLAADVRFGALRLARPMVHETGGDALLGQDVLREFVVTLDRQRGRVQIVRPDGSAADAPLESASIYGPGRPLWPEAGRHVVKRVFDGGAAKAAGVLEGDVVLAVDGVPVAERGCPDDTQSDRAPRPMRLLLERDGIRREVDLLTAELAR